MRRAILHIGWPRTGTTSLQSVLDRRRSELQEQGILYPDLALSIAPYQHWSHQHLGEALDGRRPRRERSELLGRLDSLLAGARADVVLISYEGFSQMRRPGRTVECLRRAFAARGYAPEILVTVKPQDALLNSLYTWRCQFLREARPFADYVSAKLEDRRLNYAAVLAPWRAAAGSVTAVPVRERDSGEPLVARVFAALGLQDRVGGVLRDEDLARRENRSPGPATVAVCRQLSLEGAPHMPGVDARELSRFVERLAEARGLDREPFSGFDEALRAQVSAGFAAANEQFSRSVWGKSWAERVAPEPAAERNEILEPLSDVEATRSQTRLAYGLPGKRPAGWRNWLRSRRAAWAD
jgi:hypothetical protein